MDPVTIKANGEEKVKLRPAAFLPAATFVFKNALNVPVKLVVSGSTVRLEAG